jgi:hypothetical protein
MPVTKKWIGDGNNFIKNVRKMNDMKLEWGIFSDAETYEDGMTPADVAKLNEEGHEINTPPRPFMSTNAEKEKPVLKKMIKSLYRKMTKKIISPEERLMILGEYMEESLKQEIVDWSDPPNAPSTIAKKGFNDPLINTGLMLDSVSYRINNGEDD